MKNQRTFSCIWFSLYKRINPNVMTFRFRQILCLCLGGVLCPACPRDPFRSPGGGSLRRDVRLALSLSLVCRCDAGLRARWWTLQTRTRCIARSLECLCWSPPTAQTQRLVDEQHFMQRFSQESQIRGSFSF